MSSPSLQEFKRSLSNLLCKRDSSFGQAASGGDLSHPSQDRESRVVMRDCSPNHLSGLDTVLSPHDLAHFQHEENLEGVT